MSDFLTYIPIKFCDAGQVDYHREAHLVWNGNILGSRLLKDYGLLKLCAVKKYRKRGPLYVFVDIENYEKLKEVSERLTAPIKKIKIADSLDCMENVYGWDVVRVGNIDHLAKTLTSFGFQAIRTKKSGNPCRLNAI